MTAFLGFCPKKLTLTPRVGHNYQNYVVPLFEPLSMFSRTVCANAFQPKQHGTEHRVKPPLMAG
jgi:hypothetical protein